MLREFLACYHGSRTHLSLDRNIPDRREVEPAESGTIVAEPVLGGLHHRYRRAA